MNLISAKTRVFGLFVVEKKHNAVRIDTIRECDRQADTETDGRTDMQTPISAVAIPALA